jgi:hypothetical protein
MCHVCSVEFFKNNTKRLFLIVILHRIITVVSSWGDEIVNSITYVGEKKTLYTNVFRNPEGKRPF